MDYADVLRGRRMTRNYRPDPVPPEVIERVAGSVRRAPSAGFSQGHRLVVITGRATREAIADIAEESYYTAQGMPPWISRAPVHLVLGVREADYHTRYQESDKLQEGQEISWPAPYWYVDAGALLMLIQLTAIDAGLASGFCTVRDTEALRKLLGIPGDIALVGLITLGYPAEESQEMRSRLRRRRKPLSDLLHYEHWAGRPADGRPGAR
jgi:nitroreductase